MAEMASQAESDDPLDFLKATTYPSSKRPVQSLAAELQAKPVDTLDFLKAESPPTADGPLQFLKAESSTRSPLAAQPCVACRQPLTTTYYALGDKVLCPACHARVTGPLPGSSFVRLVKATLLGLGGGLVGAAIWYAVRRFLEMQIGLVAILVGFLVGQGVRKGSGNRGGAAYQTLAVVLTYFCVAMNYMPDIIELWTRKGIFEHTHSIAHGIAVVVVTLGAALAVPVVMGMHSPIGLLIVGIALWEAWKFRQAPTGADHRPLLFAVANVSGAAPHGGHSIARQHGCFSGLSGAAGNTSRRNRLNDDDEHLGGLQLNLHDERRANRRAMFRLCDAASRRRCWPVQLADGWCIASG